MILTIASQKGGVGKSTIASLISTNLSYHYDKKVVIVDTDSPQYSLHNSRKKDLLRLKDSPEEYDALQTKWGEKLIPKIVKMPLKELSKEILDELEGEYDLVLIDVVGSINTNYIHNAFNNTNVILIPFLLDDYSFDSISDFVKLLYRYYLELAKPFHFIGFHNKIHRGKFFSLDNQEKVEVVKSLSKVPEIEILEHGVYDRQSYVKKYISTVTPMPLSGSDEKLFHEFLSELNDNLKTISNEKFGGNYN